MENFEKLLKVNDVFEFEIQKFIDIASNIEDEDLRTRIIAQMIKCQKTVIDALKKE